MRVWVQVAVGWAVTVPAAGPSCHCKETDQVARFTVTKPLIGGRTLDARNDPADFLQDTDSDLAGPDAPDPVELPDDEINDQRDGPAEADDVRDRGSFLRDIRPAAAGPGLHGGFSLFSAP